jgi:nucleotide-binding universal stress UspA family protein
VVGTRGYGPLRSALHGSVSRRLACHGSRPLMVCPARSPRAG